MGWLYVLCYSRSLSGKGNSHYLGYSAGNPDKRIEKHRTGTAGAAFTSEAHRQGIPFVVGGMWSGCTPNDERHMKRQKRHRLYCSTCTPGTTKRVPPLTRSEYVRKGRNQTAEPDQSYADDFADLPY